MSRNIKGTEDRGNEIVTLREGRVSRNFAGKVRLELQVVTLREGRVGRNVPYLIKTAQMQGHAPRGACE